MDDSPTAPPWRPATARDRDRGRPHSTGSRGTPQATRRAADRRPRHHPQADRLAGGLRVRLAERQAPARRRPRARASEARGRTREASRGRPAPPRRRSRSARTPAEPPSSGVTGSLPTLGPRSRPPPRRRARRARARMSGLDRGRAASRRGEGDRAADREQDRQRPRASWWTPSTVSTVCSRVSVAELVGPDRRCPLSPISG